ncbi:MAG: hypothetical protein AAFV45_09385 [Pseudomonadota bacterium]
MSIMERTPFAAVAWPSKQSSFRKSGCELCERHVGKHAKLGSWLLAVGVLFSAGNGIVLITNLSIQPAMSAEKRDIWIPEIKGTKLYIPRSWLTRRPDVELPPDGPKDAKGRRWSSVTFAICHAINRSSNGPDYKKFSGPRNRLVPAPEIPKDWCVGRVDIGPYPSPSPLDVFRVGPARLPPALINELLPIDENGFRKRWYKPKTKEGDYYGFRRTDVTKSGDWIDITCSRRPSTVGYSCKFGQIQTQGVKQRWFEWWITEIRPHEFRDYHRRSQAILEWLVTPPDQRPKKVPSKPANAPTATAPP